MDSAKMRFSKKVALGKLLFLTCFVANIRCSWYQWIQNFQAHHFLTGLHMNSHFWENGRWITKDKKIDFVFWRFFEIVIWRPMLKFCSLEDNRITYPKSIGSLGLCYTDADISTREVTPWPCNNFAGQCMYIFNIRRNDSRAICAIEKFSYKTPFADGN
jgi:hypothetical protein